MSAIERLEVAINQAGGVRALARLMRQRGHNVSADTISAVRLGRLDWPPRLLAALGLEKVTEVRPVERPPDDGATDPRD